MDCITYQNCSNNRLQVCEEVKLPVICSSFLSGKVFQSLVHMLERMARYTVKEHCQVVEKSLVQELQRLWSVWNDKQYSGDQEESLKSQIGFLLRMTNVWVSWKSGSLVSDPVQLFNVSTCISMQ